MLHPASEEPATGTSDVRRRIHSDDDGPMNPETLLLRSADSQSLKQALEELPVNFREVLVLRELEGLSYREIAEVSNIPPGTVMSSLSRARERLRQSLTSLLSKTPHQPES